MDKLINKLIEEFASYGEFRTSIRMKRIEDCYVYNDSREGYTYSLTEANYLAVVIEYKVAMSLKTLGVMVQDIPEPNVIL